MKNFFHIKSHKMCSYERGRSCLNIQGQEHLKIKSKDKDSENYSHSKNIYFFIQNIYFKIISMIS